MAASNTIYIRQLDAEFTIPEGTTVNNGNTNEFIDAIKRINRLPLSVGDIYYADDIWDFNSITNLSVIPAQLRFSFEAMDGMEMKDVAKNYVLLSFLSNGRKKCQSIKTAYLGVRRFLMYAEQEHHIYKVDDIPVSVVRAYMQSVRETASIRELRRVKTDLKGFFRQYCANFTDIGTKGLWDIFEQDDFGAFEQYAMEHRTDDIDKDYFNEFVAACVTVMNDTTMPYYHRAVASLYIILSQTGLRIGEILSLRVGALKTMKIFDGEEANYLEYDTWKSEKGDNASRKAFTYINKLSKAAYETLVDLYADQRKELGTDVLFLGGNSRYKPKKYPLNSSQLVLLAIKTFAYMDERGILKTIDLPDDQWPNVHRFTVHSGAEFASVPTDGHNIPAETVTFPHSQQFRFHCCSILAEKGVPLEYIQRFMAHLTGEMVRYHLLPQKSLQEDMEASIHTLKGIVTGETKILGDNKGLSEKIQQFIEENNFNVEKDLDTIVAKLAETIPIRIKTGGVCIKSSMRRDCMVDAETNEFYCAYGVCPNIVHFYYMADVSYRQCNELTESIEINKGRGHMRQVEKEQNMRSNIASKRLVPELDDLRRVIERDGVESVFETHPELKDIIENIDIIEKEASEWATSRAS